MEPLVRPRGARTHARDISKMEALPTDILTRILEFSSLSERLRLARCSKSLLDLITKECTALWVTIDLSKELYRKRVRISDAMLAGLLRRVDAHTVTKQLNLEACHNVNGWGLGLGAVSFLACARAD